MSALRPTKPPMAPIDRVGALGVIGGSVGARRCGQTSRVGCLVVLPGGPWTLAAAAVLLLLAGAKAHGRQVRLERERIGVHSVAFGRPNDARVEAIWARDRRGFWGLFAVLVAGAWAAVVLGARVAGAGALASTALLLLVAFASCFAILGLASLARLFPARPTDDPAWRRKALDGSLGWWAFVALAAALVALAF